jgi:hypothetical protein
MFELKMIVNVRKLAESETTVGTEVLVIGVLVVVDVCSKEVITFCKNRKNA